MSKSGVIVLEQTMIKSSAWLSMSGTAIQVYLLFRCKCQFMKRSPRCGNGKHSDDLMGRLLNNGELVFTYIEAAQKHKIAAGRFGRAIDELVEKGFLDIAKTGMGLYKMTTYYGISDRWRYWGTESFKSAKRPEPNIRGCGFRKGNKLWQKAKRKSQLLSVRTAGALAMRKNAHGEILAMRTGAHGQKVKNRYIYCEDKGLCVQIA